MIQTTPIKYQDASELIQNSKESFVCFTNARSLPLAESILKNCTDIRLIKPQTETNYANIKGKTIIAIGTGSVIDTAKYFSSINGLNLIAIPTALTCNACFTNKSVVFENNKPTTKDSKQPDEVIIDTKILSMNPAEIHKTGVAEALSIYTACYDWKLSIIAGKDEQSPSIYSLAQEILEDSINLTKKYPQTEEEQHKAIAQLLHSTGVLVNKHGNGRPESGSEHMFARAYETEFPSKPILHGYLVTLGILLTAELQDRESEDIYRYAQDINLLKQLEIKNLNEDTIVELFEKASRIRPDRYTVFSENHLTKLKAQKITKKVLSRLNKK